jgi:hypothetical protein
MLRKHSLLLLALLACHAAPAVYAATANSRNTCYALEPKTAEIGEYVAPFPHCIIVTLSPGTAARTCLGSKTLTHTPAFVRCSFLVKHARFCGCIAFTGTPAAA